MQDVLKRSYDHGQRAWPELTGQSLDEFCDHVQRLSVSDSNLERHGAEIYLALACGAGDQAALRILQNCYFPATEAYLARTVFDQAIRQDVFQQVLLQLCAGESPSILTYGGRAALGSWLHITTFRFAVALAGRSRMPANDDEAVSLQRLVSSNLDPETHATLETAKPMFQVALERAVAELPERDRTLLRLCFLDGLSIDSIRAMYGVQRATAARWICDIRQLQLGEVHVRQRFGLRAVNDSSSLKIYFGSAEAASSAETCRI